MANWELNLTIFCVPIVGFKLLIFSHVYMLYVYYVVGVSVDNQVLLNDDSRPLDWTLELPIAIHILYDEMEEIFDPRRCEKCTFLSKHNTLQNSNRRCLDQWSVNQAPSRVTLGFFTQRSLDCTSVDRNPGPTCSI